MFGVMLAGHIADRKSKGGHECRAEPESFSSANQRDEAASDKR